jgi:D-glycero-D-manno-heptose 1,7-bisphosphate phosphatase
MNHFKKLLQSVVFLDRDGVINRDSPDYIKSWDEFEFLPKSLEAIRHLTMNGFVTIIITNQSAVNRRIITRKELEKIHDKMKTVIKSCGGEIKDIFFCPHMPEDDCSCRKPKTGLIYRAQETYRIDLRSACMVGDSAKDIECARKAGCGFAILVRTGNGLEAESILKEKNLHPDHVALDLYEAAKWIVALRSFGRLNCSDNVKIHAD